MLTREQSMKPTNDLMAKQTHIPGKGAGHQRIKWKPLDWSSSLASFSPSISRCLPLCTDSPYPKQLASHPLNMPCTYFFFLCSASPDQITSLYQEFPESPKQKLVTLMSIISKYFLICWSNHLLHCMYYEQLGISMSFHPTQNKNFTQSCIPTAEHTVPGRWCD